MLFQNALLSGEGRVRQLCPERDRWPTGQQFLERWMEGAMGPKAVYRSMKQQAPEWLDKMPHLPQMAYDALNQLKNLDDNRRRDMLALSVARQELQQQRSQKGRWIGLLCLITAVGLSVDDPLFVVRDLPALSWLLGASAAVLLLRH